MYVCMYIYIYIYTNIHILYVLYADEASQRFFPPCHPSYKSPPPAIVLGTSLPGYHKLSPPLVQKGDTCTRRSLVKAWLGYKKDEGIGFRVAGVGGRAASRKWRSGTDGVEQVDVRLMAQASKAIFSKSRESGCCGCRGGLVFKAHRLVYHSA